MKKIVYLQFTNPGGYPPLIHSSRIFAEAGWRVLFLGVLPRGMSRVFAMPEIENREQRLLNWVGPGWRQKLHYIRYILWSMYICLSQRPVCVYCSDPLSSVPGLILRKLGFYVVYHEHDSPEPGRENLPNMVVKSRKELLRCASLVIFPNGKRLEKASNWSESKANAFVVWNCPSKLELKELATKTNSVNQKGILRLYYHGTWVPDRLPLTIIEAMSRCEARIELTLVGYTTVGCPDYDSILSDHAQNLGISGQLIFRGSLPTRDDILRECRKQDVGLVLFTGKDWETYAAEMAGASNKPFDYLSQEVAVVVPRVKEWRELYEDRGCAVNANVEDPDALASLFDWLAANPDKVSEMGKNGRMFIENEWNYETQFEPVINWINTHCV